MQCEGVQSRRFTQGQKVLTSIAASELHMYNVLTALLPLIVTHMAASELKTHLALTALL
eukprot:COSAG01_NODE_46586_length_398_cov_222.257525_1_plen_58_part_10